MGLVSRLLYGARAPERDRFAKALLERIRDAHNTAAIIYDAELFQLRPQGSDGLVLNLHNIYDEYRQTAPEARPSLLDQFVEAWISVHRRKTPDDFIDAKRHLLPVVRSSAYPDLVSLQSQVDGADAPEIPFAALNDELILCLIYQMPGVARIVTADLLDGWNITFYEAMEAARENFGRLQAPHFSSPIAGLYIADTRDSHDATRLICREAIEDLTIEGEHVLMALNRDLLLIAGSDNAAALVVMAMFAERGLHDSRHITGTAFRLCGEELVPWLPERDDELRGRFLRLRLRSQAQRYAHQGELLDQFYERIGDDAKAADFEVADGDQNEPYSYCVWTEGAPLLLPKTDKIVFETNPVGSEIAVGWDTAFREFSALMQPTGSCPERFQVDQAPPYDHLLSLYDEPR